MGRSNGYRPTKANEKVIMRLRAKLGKVRASEWQKASCIMQEITGILGHRGGPGNSMIQPRACTACGFYGHTKQWCKARLANEMSAGDEDRLYRQRMGIAAGRQNGKTDETWSKWYAWAWRRYDAARAAGGGCETACGECKGCDAWNEAVLLFLLSDPEPPKGIGGGAHLVAGRLAEEVSLGPSP